MSDIAPSPETPAPAIVHAPSAPAPKGRSPFGEARARLMHNPAALASVCLLGALAILAIVGPLLWNVAPGAAGAAPSGAHTLGTDASGRDGLTQLLLGLRVTLFAGVAATFVAAAIGVVYGALASVFGGAMDRNMMRLSRMLAAIPLLLFVVALMAVTPVGDAMSRLALIVLAVGATQWIDLARIVRDKTVSLRRQEFVDAARAAGVTPLAIVARHVVPNVLWPVVVRAALSVPAIILAESMLSFLGLGVPAPLTSLGALIADGVRNPQQWWLLAPPALTMLVLLFALMCAGDGLRDAFEKER